MKYVFLHFDNNGSCFMSLSHFTICIFKQWNALSETLFQREATETTKVFACYQSLLDHLGRATLKTKEIVLILPP